MFTSISPLLTRENITLALSIFGTIGTLVTLTSSYLTKRKNLKVNLVSFTYRIDLERLMLSLTFENRSRLPIAIISISVIKDNKELNFEPYPSCVGEYTHRHGNEIVDRKFEYNLNLPVDIQQLSAVSGVVLFGISPTDLENLSTPLTLLIRSTRGKVQKIELPPDQIKWI